MKAICLVPRERGSNSIADRDAVERFLETGYRAALHHFFFACEIQVTAGTDARDSHISCGKRFEQLKPIHSRHAHIKNQTSFPASVVSGKKFRSRVVGFNLEADRHHKCRHRSSSGVIVVDDKNGSFIRHLCCLLSLFQLSEIRCEIWLLRNVQHQSEGSHRVLQQWTC